MPATNVVYPQIELAFDIVASELEIANIEANAFRSFQRRLHRMDPAVPRTGGGIGSVAESVSAGGIDPDRLKAAYRDTVLSMDHYGNEYGEPLLENISAEFGPEIRVLLAGSNPIQVIQQRLIKTAASRAVEERTMFCEMITEERDSLQRVEEELGSVERRFHDLIESTKENRQATTRDCGRVRQLENLAEECQSVSETRQRTLHERKSSEISGIGDISLTAYLYDEHEYRFPALVEINCVSEQILRAIESIEQG